ncbi:hypothetical protein F7725_016302, partial [Dissostichus mawsoni]
MLSLVAFLLEEVVSSCLSCSALYFFEFVSFLFTLLLLIFLATPLHGHAFGFLATLMFFSDVGYSLQTRGLPFKSDGAPETRNGGVTPAAEEEKLNGELDSCCQRLGDTEEGMTDMDCTVAILETANGNLMKENKEFKDKIERMEIQSRKFNLLCEPHGLPLHAAAPHPLATPLHGSVGISCWPKLAFGFLATLMFFSDVGYSLQTRGLPFKSDGAPETRNGGVTPAAEEEKLNVPEQ